MPKLPSPTPKATPILPPHSKSADAGYISRRKGGSAPKDLEPVDMADDRKALYERYAETEGQEIQVEPEVPPEEGTPEVPPVTGTPEEIPETPEIEKDGEPSEKGEEPKEKKSEEKSKTVPHEALHEEREKHKLTRSERDGFKSENSELRSQNLELLKAVKNLTDRLDTTAKPPAKAPELPTDMSDPEAVIRHLNERINELEGKTSKIETRTEAERATAMRNDLNARIETAHTDLEKEGFQGFKLFLDQVSAEVRNEIGNDNSKVTTVDTPENWKRIYKEKVYPKLQGVFAKQQKDEKVNAKLEAKKNAALIGTPGGAEKSTPPEKKEWGFNDYLSWSRKQRAS